MDFTLLMDRRQRVGQARVDRVELIRAAAIVRDRLGQAACHALLPDGRHRVSCLDVDRIVRVGVGDTIEAAIVAALEGKAEG